MCNIVELRLLDLLLWLGEAERFSYRMTSWLEQQWTERQRLDGTGCALTTFNKRDIDSIHTVRMGELRYPFVRLNVFPSATAINNWVAHAEVGKEIMRKWNDSYERSRFPGLLRATSLQWAKSVLKQGDIVR